MDKFLVVHASGKGPVAYRFESLDEMVRVVVFWMRHGIANIPTVTAWKLHRRAWVPMAMWQHEVGA